MTQLTHTPHCYQTTQFEIGYDDGQYAKNKIEPSAGLKPTYSSVIKWGVIDIHGNIHDVQTSHPVDDVPSDDDHSIHDEPARPKTPWSLATSALKFFIHCFGEAASGAKNAFKRKKKAVGATASARAGGSRISESSSNQTDRGSANLLKGKGNERSLYLNKAGVNNYSCTPLKDSDPSHWHIPASHVRAQVATVTSQAPPSSFTQYPKKFRNDENLTLKSESPRREYPIIPDTYTQGMRPGPVRAIYSANAAYRGNELPAFDVVYHHPRIRDASKRSGRFFLATYKPGGNPQ